MVEVDQAEGKRLQIVRHAFQRFYEGGFHATGIDRVMADSGISKRTLYKYFPSKEDLIEAVLDHYTAGIVDQLFEVMKAPGDGLPGQILTFFDVREAMIEIAPTRGCLGMRAAQEYVGKHEGIAGRGLKATLEVERRFLEICEGAGFEEPATLARQINIMFQGALLLAQASRVSTPFADAKRVVSMLLANAPRKKLETSPSLAGE